MQAIIVQTFIAAPPASVWASLDAHADLLFDGLPADAWPAGEDQPPFHRKVTWPFTRTAGADTTVELVLHDMGGGTRLDVRHSGWGEGPAWDTAIEGHFPGWLQGLAALGFVIETHVDPRVRNPALKGRERYFISGEVPAAPAAIYRALTDAAVLSRWSAGVFDGAEAVELIENRFLRWRSGPSGGAAVEITAILRPTPRGTHVALAEYGIAGAAASGRWPAMFERLTRFLG